MKRTLKQLAKQRQATKDCNERWKRAAHAALGGKCVRCGFEDTRALQIDHVNGGGTREQHRRRLKDGVLSRRLCLSKYYRLVVNDASGKYQLLCANCNWIKRAENGEMRLTPKETVISGNTATNQMTFTWQKPDA